MKCRNGWSDAVLWCRQQISYFYSVGSYVNKLLRCGVCFFIIMRIAYELFYLWRRLAEVVLVRTTLHCVVMFACSLNAEVGCVLPSSCESLCSAMGRASVIC